MNNTTLSMETAMQQPGEQRAAPENGVASARECPAHEQGEKPACPVDGQGEHAADPVDPPGLIGQLHRSAKLMGRVRHRQGPAHHGQGRILALLSAHGPVSQRDLLEILDVRSSSLSEVLAKLERSGLVMRKRDEQDKRNFVISLTEQGKTCIAGREEEFRRSAEAIFADFSPREREDLGRLLAKLNAGLEGLYSGPERDGEHGPGHRRGHDHEEVHGRVCGHGHERGHGPDRAGHGRAPGRGPGRNRMDGPGRGRGFRMHDPDWCVF